MRRKAIETVLLLFVFLDCVVSVNAQDEPRSRRFIVSSQFAGSIGFISAGAGLTNRKQKIHYELLYGHVPRQYGGPTDKLTFKTSWYPVSGFLNNRIRWHPINPGIFAALNFGDRFPLVPSRAKYSREYYWWSPGLRFHLSFNSALSFQLSRKKEKKLMLFIETNTNDRYVTTFFSSTNTNEMSFWEIWKLGCGGKILF